MPCARNGGDIHVFNVQRNVMTGAQVGTELHPPIGILANAVMDMQCGKVGQEKRAASFVQQMQQYHRVYTTTQADQNGAMRRKQRRDLRRDSFSEIIIGDHDQARGASFRTGPGMTDK